MTRKYKPTVIAVGHDATVWAERRREIERPEPARPAEREERAAWEAQPEPEPARLPRYGRVPRKVNASDLDSSPALSMFDKALQATPDPQVKRRLVTAQREMRAQLAREIADLPPGADPSAYGL